METDKQRNRKAKDYIPLISWATVVLVLLLIPLKIISSGFVPDGDARRHVAKAFTDKPYTDIVVMRSGYGIDHSPGWEWLLRVLAQKVGLNEDALMSFSVVSLLLCILLIPLLWMRRPEAWLAALMAEMVAIPELMTRFTQARPYLLTETILIAVLFSWSKTDTKNPSRLKCILTCIGFSLSTWVHGAWYLWGVVLAAFFLVGWWRTGIWLTGCWVVGTLGGALMTGSPVVLLDTTILPAVHIYQEHAPQWLLVGELQPSYGEFSTLTLLALVFLWRKQQNATTSGLLYSPLVALILIGWILGFKADRFWADWGVPAVLVWLAIQFEEIMIISWNAISLKRLMVSGVLAVTVFMHSTNDLDRRYTGSLDEIFLDASDPNLKGWLPEAGGIFYNSQMQFFYNTFYKNPQADWRYILGFEPVLMPEADLKILRSIQSNQGALKYYEPWIKKMLSADRLVIFSSSQPDLPELEWHNTIGDIWIGRLPKGKLR